jgi:ubiquinol-cytochrome c reductase iron-sulfur subunit
LLIHAADSAVVTRAGRETWSPMGYLAFSKVCTHAGCPVGLYEHKTRQLLCPCHQSLFDVARGAKPVFGPAPRALPQLPLAVDVDGYLIAQRDFLEPVGPTYWSRP